MSAPRVLSLVTNDAARVDEIAPPIGKRCRYRVCDRPATAVAISASAASYPAAYCAKHGRAVELLRRRHVTYFPVCTADRCDELASTLALVHTGPTRAEWQLVCDLHRCE